MVTVGTVEKKIKQIEGFKINFTKDGKDVRADKAGIPQYQYTKAARDTHTVAEWIAGRFNNQYSGYNVNVLYFNGKAANGNATLKNVRETYRE